MEMTRKDKIRNALVKASAFAAAASTVASATMTQAFAFGESVNVNKSAGDPNAMMGKVIGEVKAAFKRADGRIISECVKKRIS